MSCIQQCSLSLSNTGTECVPIFDITDKIWFVRKYAADGTQNRISIAALEAAVEAGTENAFFDAMINHADASKRWYPVGSFKNVSDEREDANYFDWDDGSKYYIRDGVRTFTGLIPDGAAQLKGRIESFRGFEVSALYITKSNQAVGKISSDSLYIEPIDLEAPSIAAKFTKRGASSPQSLAVRFDVKSTENDTNLRVIDCSELGGVSLNDKRGLLDVIAAISDITDEGFTMTLTADWGTPLNPFAATGFSGANVYSNDSDADGQMYNATDEVDINFSMTEGEDGVYAVVFGVAQDFSDVITFYLSKTGYGVSDTITVTLPVS